jgi:hypothetical protein
MSFNAFVLATEIANFRLAQAKDALSLHVLLFLHFVLILDGKILPKILTRNGPRFDDQTMLTRQKGILHNICSRKNGGWRWPQLVNLR